jgi:hypothetical protein
VEVLQIGVLEGGAPAWSMVYRTEIPLSDRGRLECEVAALWPEVQDRAKASGLPEAYISAVSFRKRVSFARWPPLLVTQERTAFFFRKREGGWTVQECSQ